MQLFGHPKIITGRVFISMSDTCEILYNLKEFKEKAGHMQHLRKKGKEVMFYLYSS